ncbi:hypothetical protein BSM4216_2166 [Bacillus smithii]|nr:hypothetical protein BSM4216_2166 [Bacillus smithii]
MEMSGDMSKQRVGNDVIYSGKRQIQDLDAGEDADIKNT